MARYKLHYSVLLGMTLLGALAWSQGTSSQSQQTSEKRQTSQSGTGRASASSSASASSNGGQRASASGGGSQSASSLPKPTHALFYRIVGEDGSVSERVMQAHNEYLVSLARAGRVILSGPWRDEPGEMTLVQVRTDEQADEIIANDPAVKAGAMTGERKAWRVNIYYSGAGPAR